jgi:hypothetical protein
MTIGKGAYSEVCEAVGEEVEADMVVLIVFGGNKGDGFAVATIEPNLMRTVPGFLRATADHIESDLVADAAAVNTLMPADRDLQFDTSLVAEQLAKDPKLAEHVRDLGAKFRQAFESVKTGQHKTMDEALRALGIDMEKRDPRTGEVIAGASMHRDMGLGRDEDDDDEE